MADLDFSTEDIKQARLTARRGAHIQRVHQMLVAAGLASLCVVAVAGAFLSQVM